MPLSPKDVEQKTFNASFRGYAEDEVDGFLEEVIASIEEYQQMVRERDAKIAELEAGLVMAPVTAPVAAPKPEIIEPEPEPVPEPVRPPAAPIDESAVSRALIVAQRTADQLVDDANKEADRIIEEARRQAIEFEHADAERREHLIDGYRRLRGELAGLRNRMGDSFSTAEATFKSLEVEIDEMLSREVPVREPNPSEIGELGAEAVQHAEEDVHVVEGSDRRPWERG